MIEFETLVVNFTHRAVVRILVAVGTPAGFGAVVVSILQLAHLIERGQRQTRRQPGMLRRGEQRRRPLAVVPLEPADREIRLGVVMF